MKYAIAILIIILIIAGIGALLFDVGRAPAVVPVDSSAEATSTATSAATSTEAIATTTETTATSTLSFDNLKSGQRIESPVTITGKAPGSWFFEASFPIRVLDSAGDSIGQGTAQAKGDWMAPGDVAFTTTITFASTTGEGSIIFEKDNPSGLPQNAGEVKVPVRF